MTQLVQYFDGTCTQSCSWKKLIDSDAPKNKSVSSPEVLQEGKRIMKQLHCVTKQGTM